MPITTFIIALISGLPALLLAAGAFWHSINTRSLIPTDRDIERELDAIEARMDEARAATESLK
jgi:hypothetical protein